MILMQPCMLLRRAVCTVYTNELAPGQEVPPSAGFPLYAYPVGWLICDMHRARYPQYPRLGYTSSGCTSSLSGTPLLTIEYLPHAVLMPSPATATPRAA